MTAPVHNLQVVFVGGVHGAGKTRVSEEIAARLGASRESASSLIKDYLQRPVDDQKRVVDIPGNQDALISALGLYRCPSGVLVLDGHYCLLDKERRICDVPLSTFEELHPLVLAIVIAEPGELRRRLLERDGVDHDESFLQQFQEAERRRASTLSKAFQIPMFPISDIRDLPPLIDRVTAALSA